MKLKTAIALVLAVPQLSFASSLAEEKSLIKANKNIAEGVEVVKKACDGHTLKVDIKYEDISEVQKLIDANSELLHATNQGSDWQEWRPETSIANFAQECRQVMEGIAMFCASPNDPDTMAVYWKKIKEVKTLSCVFAAAPSKKIVEAAVKMKAGVMSTVRDEMMGRTNSYLPKLALEKGVLRSESGLRPAGTDRKVKEFLERAL